MTLPIWPLYSSFPSPLSPEPTLLETTVRSFTTSFRLDKASMRVSWHRLYIRPAVVSTIRIGTTALTRCPTQSETYTVTTPSSLCNIHTRTTARTSAQHDVSRLHIQDRLVDRVPHLLLARHGPLRAGTGAVRAPLVTRTMQLSSNLAADQRSTNGGRSAHVPCWTSPQEDPRRDRPRHTHSPCGVQHLQIVLRLSFFSSSSCMFRLRVTVTIRVLLGGVESLPGRARAGVCGQGSGSGDTRGRVRDLGRRPGLRAYMRAPCTVRRPWRRYM